MTPPIDPRLPRPVPENAIGWKFADPTEDGRWIYDEEDAAEISRADPDLVVLLPND